MKLTAPFALSSRPIEQNGLLFFINREATVLLRQLRTFANALGTEVNSADSLGAGAYVRVWTSDALPTDAAWTITANVVGVSTSGAAQRASYGLAGLFESTAGTISQIGATTSLWTIESAAACNARFGVDATNRVIYVEARDDAVSPMRWTAVTAINEGLTA